MRKVIDDPRFEFPEIFGRLAHCRLRVYEDTERVVAIATEVLSNQLEGNVDVEAGAELLIGHALDRLDLRGRTLTWVEHHSDRISHGIEEPVDPDRLMLVEVDAGAGAQVRVLGRRALGRRDLEAMLGGPLG